MSDKKRRKLSKGMKVFLSIVMVLVIVLGLTAVEFLQKDKIKKIPSRPEVKYDVGLDDMLYKVEHDIPLSEADYVKLANTCDYVDGRYDCADFRLQSMLRLMYDAPEAFTEDAFSKLKTSLLGFKYWMDQPGEDSMCFWSENHQILFAASEYLVGQYFPNEIFTNDGKIGLEHQEIAEERILIWLEQRWLYGFTEWYSSTYYVEDIAPLSNLIDFAESKEIRLKATIILDLLLHDLATQSYEGAFASTSGRMYEDSKKAGNHNSMRAVSESIWDYQVGEDRQGMDQNFLYINNYQVPGVLVSIGYDHDDVVIKASNGLNLTELEDEGLRGTQLNQVMMQWAMEAFTNPEIIHETMTYIHRNDMLANEFLNDFKMIDLSLLRWTHLLPTVSRILNPKTNGVAIQRANTYTYRTDDFMMATAQKYHPGDFGDQQHIWTVTLDNDVSIFTTHPAKPLSDEGALSNSPSYWVGNGRNPHSVQYQQVNMSMYVIGDDKGFMEDYLVEYTHAYFPEALMDEVILDNNIIFGKKGDALIAMIGKEALAYADEDNEDLWQEGNVTYWITEMSSIDNESFEDFIERIRGNEINFDEEALSLNYQSQGMDYELTYQADFLVDGQIQDMSYDRFESPYSQTERKADVIQISYEDQSLTLDFYNMIRIVED